MKIITQKLIGIFLLFVTTSQCFALMSVAVVSKNVAKEMGIKVNSKTAGPDMVRVDIEFKTIGKLAGFDLENDSRVEMRVLDGEKFLAKCLSMYCSKQNNKHRKVCP